MVTSYRKLSIGLTIAKIIDCYMEDTIKMLIKINQSPYQYGFTALTDFKCCAVLRDTAVKVGRMKDKTTLITASDVSNAFSRTTRETQMYELWRSGERLQVYMFSRSTYQKTFTVLKNMTSWSPIILEQQGSRQGGKMSAEDYVTYNSSWSRMIKASKMGLDILGIQIGGFIVADDALGANSNLAELLAMCFIYEYFSSSHDVLFAYSKTVLNCFNNPSRTVSNVLHL